MQFKGAYIGSMLLVLLIAEIGFSQPGQTGQAGPAGQQGSLTRILDDTTHLSYGPLSTRFTTEEDIRFNEARLELIDTTLFTSYRRSKVELYNYRYQNLGLEGTALRPIFYELPSNLGVSPGPTGFAPYYKGPGNIRYYNTRSPYSRMSIFLGGGNRSITDVEFSRNDSVNLNFGIDFSTLAIDKQIERTGRGDRRASSTQYDAYAQVRSSNLKYELLANFTRMRHLANESGGVDTTEVGDFFDQDVSVILNNVQNIELRQGLHVYHQYSIKEFLEVYNSLGTYRQRNEYIDANLDENRDYYDKFLISSSETADSTDYKHEDIELGLKGSLGGLYYNGYWKRRSYKFINKYADSIQSPYDLRTMNRSGTEKYYGFHSRYRLNRKAQVRGGLEILQGGNFEAYGQFSGYNFILTYKRGKYKPSFLQQAYLGNHRFWVNNFRPVFADSFRGEYSLNLKNVMFSPTAGYDLVTDYIYFDKDTLPAQNRGNAVVITPGIKFRFNFLRNFSFDGNAVYTMLSGSADSVMSIPEVFVYARLFYRNKFFDENLEAFIGVDVNYKSAYFGQGYDPVTQQFYLQDQTLVEGVPIANFFLNFKIRRANLFVKMTNLAQMITREGYMVAPLYRGLPPSTDFGVTLWFFD